MLRSRGVTLLETLFVVGVVAVLVGILVPAVSGVRHRARVAADQSNMRQLLLAHRVYVDANDGWMIDVGLAHGGISNEEVAWVNTLEEQYHDELVLRSPLDDSPHWPLDKGGLGEPVDGTMDVFRRTSYGCNNFLTSYNPSFAVTGDVGDLYDRIEKVRRPATTVHFLIMAFTGPFAGADHVHVENWSQPFAGVSLAEAPMRAYEECQINAVSGPAVERDDIANGTISVERASPLWNSHSNYGFVDGSVRSLKFSEVFTDFDRNRFDPKLSARHDERRNEN